MSELYNQVRFFHYISHVLQGQEADPICCRCKAFVNTVIRTEENIAEWESAHAQAIVDLPGNIRLLLTAARNEISTIKRAVDAVGQKKAGNCAMPEGVCFVKISKGIRDTLLDLQAISRS